MSTLEIKDLYAHVETKDGIKPILKGVNLTVNSGETHAIMGPNGSGKSTLASAVLRLLPQRITQVDGEILYNGKDLLKLTKDEMDALRWTDLSIVFQKSMSALSPVHKVGAQMEDVYRVHFPNAEKEEIKQRVYDLFKVVNLSDRVYELYPHELSGGMMQRVSIALSLLHNPRLLVLDEATTALDVVTQSQILREIMSLEQNLNVTRIMITHDVSVVASTCKKIAVMYAGDIVEVGLCEEIFYNAKHPYSWALLSSLPQLGVKGEPLYSIKGTPPNLFNEIKGDAFAPRNPRALKIDFEIRPPYFEVSPTHKARTWLLDPRAPKVEPPALIARMFEKWKEVSADA